MNRLEDCFCTQLAQERVSPDELLATWRAAMAQVRYVRYGMTSVPADEAARTIRHLSSTIIKSDIFADIDGSDFSRISRAFERFATFGRKPSHTVVIPEMDALVDLVARMIEFCGAPFAKIDASIAFAIVDYDWPEWLRGKSKVTMLNNGRETLAAPFHETPILDVTKTLHWCHHESIGEWRMGKFSIRFKEDVDAALYRMVFDQPTLYVEIN